MTPPDQRARNLDAHALLTTGNLDTAGMKYVIADIVEDLDQSRVLPRVVVHRITDTPLEHRLQERTGAFFELDVRVPRRPAHRFVRRIVAAASKDLRPYFMRNRELLADLARLSLMRPSSN